MIYKGCFMLNAYPKVRYRQSRNAHPLLPRLARLSLLSKFLSLDLASTQRLSFALWPSHATACNSGLLWCLHESQMLLTLQMHSLVAPAVAACLGF